MSKKEMMRVHGMNPSKFKCVVPESELGLMLGNTMSVCVIERVLINLLYAARLVPAPLHDGWLSGARQAQLIASVGQKFLVYEPYV